MFTAKIYCAEMDRVTVAEILYLLRVTVCKHDKTIFTNRSYVLVEVQSSQDLFNAINIINKNVTVPVYTNWYYMIKGAVQEWRNTYL